MCVCIIILWVGVSFDVCIYSSCPFLVYFVFMLILIRYNATSFWGRGGMAQYKIMILLFLEVTFELC